MGYGRGVGEENGPVPVSKQILEGLEAIRESDYTNILDRPTVMRLADQISAAYS